MLIGSNQGEILQVILVGCGDEHTAVVTDTGRLFTFGCNEWGQLGLGHNNNTQRPSCVKVHYDSPSIIERNSLQVKISFETATVYPRNSNPFYIVNYYRKMGNSFLDIK